MSISSDIMHFDIKYADISVYFFYISVVWALFFKEFSDNYET